MQELSKKCGSLRKIICNSLDILRYTSKDSTDGYHLKYLIDIHIHLAAGNNHNHYSQRKPTSCFAGFSFKLAARKRAGIQNPIVLPTKKATNNPDFWNPLNSTALLQKVFSGEFSFWKGGGQCRLNPRKQSRRNHVFMTVHGKEVTQLRQITESIWRHWFQEHWGLQLQTWCSCTARNFNLHKHISLKILFAVIPISFA